jgi:5-hydroxyisourate hydrolase-like protein (transthyretin family)
MTRTAHRIGLAIVVALVAAAGAGTTAAYAESGTTAVTSSISLSLSGGTRITVGEQASLAGVLSFSDGSPANGITLHVTRTNPDDTQTVVGDVTTTSDQGGFSVVDTPPARGAYTYTATFDGDAQRSGATGTSDVLKVDGIVTALGLKTSAAKVGYRRRVTLTAHLGTHGTNGVVSIYKRPAAGGARTLVRSAAVDADGNLTVTVRPRRNTTFDAVFAGDDVFRAAASPKVTVAVRVAIAGTLSRFYATSGAYHLYRYSAGCVTRGRGCPRYTVSVAPGHAGENVRLTLAFHSSSGWVVVGHERVKLNARSRTRILLRYANRAIIGQRFRLQAQFRRDGSNAGNATAWSYLRVTG